MKNIKINIVIIALFLLPVIFSLLGCGDTIINSKWRTQNLIIDGKENDWGNSLTYIDDLKALVGIENDDKYLYLCLVTNDQDLESKVLRMGLTVWFDNTAGDEKDFGIRFPIGRGGVNREAMRKEMEGSESQRPNPEKMREMLIKNEYEAEIVGKNNDVNRLPITELKGIELKLGLSNSRLVYEIKIPLSHKGGFNYALSADTNSTISIGLETGSFKRNPNNENRFRQPEGGEGGFDSPNGEGRGDNFGGERGERRGGFGERHGEFNNSSLEPVSFWAKVKLTGK